jgi:hypothetical protein
MQITIGLWILPALLTLACAGLMLRPYQRSGDYDFGAIFRLFWLLPIGFIWAAYFGVLLLLR